MSKYADKDELWERLRKSMVHHIVTNTLFNTIKAVIDGIPTIEVSEDCISRSALLKEVKMDIEDDGLQEKMIFYRIKNAPSVVPKERIEE